MRYTTITRTISGYSNTVCWMNRGEVVVVIFVSKLCILMYGLFFCHIFTANKLTTSFTLYLFCVVACRCSIRSCSFLCYFSYYIYDLKFKLCFGYYQLTVILIVSIGAGTFIFAAIRQLRPKDILVANVGFSSCKAGCKVLQIHFLSVIHSKIHTCFISLITNV